MSKLLLAGLVAAAASLVATSECPEHGIAYKDSYFPSPNGAFLANWEACQKSCELSPSCEVFTFKKNSVPPGGCWLLSKSAASETDGEAISGPKACAEADAAGGEAVASNSASLAAAAAPAVVTDAPVAVAQLTVSPSLAPVAPEASKEESASTKPGMGQGLTLLLLVAIVALVSMAAYGLYRSGAFDLCQPERKKVSRGLSYDPSEAEEEDEPAPKPHYAPAAAALLPPTGYLTPAAYPTTPMLTASMAPGAGLQLAQSGDPRQMLLPVPQYYYAQPGTMAAIPREMPGTMAAVPGVMPTYQAVPQGPVLEPVTGFSH